MADREPPPLYSEEEPLPIENVRFLHVSARAARPVTAKKPPNKVKTTDKSP